MACRSALSSNYGQATFPSGDFPFLNTTADFGVLNQAANSSLIGLAFQTDSFAALVRFLETQGQVQVLSSPRIAAINNQKAVLKVGVDEFFITEITSTPNQRRHRHHDLDQRHHTVVFLRHRARCDAADRRSRQHHSACASRRSARW
jgi:type II secretory pathway component GspD/PulD (secretin)